MNFWSQCGFDSLQPNDGGWLVPTDDYLRLFVARPELALVPESCTAERALHQRLRQQPGAALSEGDIRSLLDTDAQDNYRVFLRFRDALLAAGSLQACYLQLVRGNSLGIPTALVDMLAQTIVRHVLQGETDALMLRAAEMLFRAQRVSVQEGRILAGDRDALDVLQDSGGLGDLGRMLVQNKTPLATQQVQVLSTAHAGSFANDICQARYAYRWLLDLTHEQSSAVGQGQHQFEVRLTRSDSGLAALARVLQRWVMHFLRVPVRITPLAKVEDSAWRWHTGLDAESSALLNDLYTQQEVSDERLQRLISLFRLDFQNPADCQADMAGKPVYLGLAMNAEGLLRLKPQNLLLNLPLATVQ